MQERVDADTILLPVVEVGNLGKEHVDKIYYTKNGDNNFNLFPLLSLRKSLQEMYAGDSEHARRLFYLASLLPRELVIKHIDKIITAGDIPTYLSNKGHSGNTVNIMS